MDNRQTYTLRRLIEDRHLKIKDLEVFQGGSLKDTPDEAKLIPVVDCADSLSKTFGRKGGPQSQPVDVAVHYTFRPGTEDVILLGRV